MSWYTVKIGFWLRAYETLTVEAETDAQAIMEAKVAALIAMQSTAHPEHIDLDERREGIVAWIDRITPDGREAVADDVAFDDDRIHPPPSA
ncbi:hypothetical protein [Halodurantibacterium flavum]|uniref:Uncharacterized protein n=1 Tax=Halodurantibacterium flavum TaxID=1382802 RepID=A0ABW4S2L6_9RHOB